MLVADIARTVEVLGRKLVDSDLTGDMLTLARDYLRAYDGTFALLVDIKASAERTHTLTRPQARAVLNCAVAEYRRKGTDYSTVLEALRALVSVCDGARELDGQGYNGVDAPFGHDLASKDSLTERQAKAAVKMLRKYRGQLAGFGIDWGTLPFGTSPSWVDAYDIEETAPTGPESGVKDAPVVQDGITEQTPENAPGSLSGQTYADTEARWAALGNPRRAHMSRKQHVAHQRAMHNLYA